MMAHNVGGVAIMTSEFSARLIDELTRRKIAITFLDLAPARDMSALCASITLLGSSKLSIPVPTGAPRDRLCRRQAKTQIQRGATGGLRALHAGSGLKPGPVLHGDCVLKEDLPLDWPSLKCRPGYCGDGRQRSHRGGRDEGVSVAGLRIPQDISVTGFDKTRLAEYSNPRSPPWTSIGIYSGKWRPMPCMHFVAPPILKAGIRGFRGTGCGRFFGTLELLAALPLRS